MNVDKWLLEMKLRIRKQVKREFNDYIQYFINKDNNRNGKFK